LKDALDSEEENIGFFSPISNNSIALLEVKREILIRPSNDDVFLLISYFPVVSFHLIHYEKNKISIMKILFLLTIILYLTFHLVQRKDKKS